MTFAQGSSFITYRDLGHADAVTVRHLVAEALHHCRSDAFITSVKWKSRAHDRAPGLHEALVDNGFVAGDSESIMIGETRLLAKDVALPPGVALHTIQSDVEITRMTQMQAEVFGDLDPAPMAMALRMRLARKDGMELWVAEADGTIVCSGRLEPVAGTAFAGIWGGATRSAWRGKGIYRALTAARARSALASTAASRGWEGSQMALADTLGIGDRCHVLHEHGLQSATQVGRRIAFRTPGRDHIPEHLAGPSKLYFSRHHLPPLGLTSRYRKENLQVVDLLGGSGTSMDVAGRHETFKWWAGVN